MVTVVIGDREVPLYAMGEGVFETEVAWARPGMKYLFSVDGRSLPDPYARFLPEGVHGPAEIVDASYPWINGPQPIHLEKAPVIYELHVGTFTDSGTYAAAELRLDHLVELGVSVIELMPLAAFPGERGWGYDGVALHAPFAPYGRPEQLKHFLDTAHGRGLSVIIDVVLNHFGPDGNYLGAWAPEYFDASVSTPWGPGPAFGHPRMRKLVLDVVSDWLTEYRFDGVRLDATHAIPDRSLLGEITALAHALPQPRVVIAEDERRDPGLITQLGMDAVWADDLHHAFHVMMTGEQDGYYHAYRGTLGELTQTLQLGWRGPSEGVARDRLVTCLQNHDQVGNRALGERISALADRRSLDAATLLWLLLPTTPLIFMGQEWGASTPFLYFTDHTPDLGEKVVEGRRREFAKFTSFAGANIPSPQAESTAAASTLRWGEIASAPHRQTLELFRQAIALRRTDVVFSRPRASTLEVRNHGAVLEVTLRKGRERRMILWNTGNTPVPCPRRALLASERLSDAVLPPRVAAIFRED